MATEYEEFGEGDHPVLALHGWFGSATAWRPLQPHLNRTRFHYVFPEFRGYGTRRSEPGEHSLEEAAQDILSVADEFGFERFSLLGHSMGGTIMQRVLVQAPQRVRALVGISPVPASGMPFDEKTWELFAGAAAEPANRRAIIDLTTGHRLTDIWLDAKTHHTVDNADQHAISDYLIAWAKTDFHTEIEGSTVPVKVIVGEADPAINESTMRETFATWYTHCDTEVFANAGHYTIDETPVSLATSIENFLAKV